MAIQQPQHHQQCQQRHQKCQSILCNSGPNIGLRWMSEEIEFGIIRSYMRMSAIGRVSAMCIALASVACICDHLLKSIEVSLGQFSRSSTTTHEFCNHSASRQMYARQVCAQIGPIKTKPKKKTKSRSTNERRKKCWTATFHSGNEKHTPEILFLSFSQRKKKYVFIILLWIPPFLRIHA